MLKLEQAIASGEVIKDSVSWSMNFNERILKISMLYVIEIHRRSNNVQIRHLFVIQDVLIIFDCGHGHWIDRCDELLTYKVT